MAVKHLRLFDTYQCCSYHACRAKGRESKSCCTTLRALVTCKACLKTPVKKPSQIVLGRKA